MAFWTYILHCRGGYFYTGHTDDLERRMAEHEAGEVVGFVRDHWPAKLVWSSDFATRYEALSAERQIKGWSRAKKLALIRGDWDRISDLAKGKDGASTSSARTGEPADLRSWEPPISLFLHPHLEHLPAHEFSLEVIVGRRGSTLNLRYRLAGPAGAVLAPRPAPSLRRDRLWERTCFEAFVRPAPGSDYIELNLSPSTEWAAYRFDSHREGMAPLDMEQPRIRVKRDRHVLELVAAAAVPAGQGDLNLNLAAVIEETDGTKSYWALAHPPSGPPDFHHPDCFALTLPAPGGA